jgi:hypothetical protein
MQAREYGQKSSLLQSMLWHTAGSVAYCRMGRIWPPTNMHDSHAWRKSNGAPGAWWTRTQLFVHGS